MHRAGAPAAAALLVGISIGTAAHAHAGPPRVHALRGAKVVVAPGRTVDPGTIVMRDGRISAVGPADRVAIPPDARLWDGKGLTVYAGFIEPYLERAYDEDKEAARPDGSDSDPGVAGPSAAYSRVRPERRAVVGLAPAIELRRELRGLGYTAACFVPAPGAVRGTAALAGLADVPPNEAVIAADIAMAAAFEPAGEDSRSYPGSTMGAIACFRQMMLDARHYHDDQADYAQHPGTRERPQYDPALEALQPVVSRALPVLLAASGVLMEDRAARVCRELGVDPVLVSTGEEWRRPDLIRAVRVPLILPLTFPDVPRVDQDADWVQISLDELRAWDWSAENPALVARLGLPFALTTQGLKDRGDFWKKLRAARDRGLTHDLALAALTTVPAQIYRVQDRLGTSEAGRIANLTVLAGALLDDDVRVDSVWIDGACYPSPPRSEQDEQKQDAQKPGDQPAGGAQADKKPPAARVAREPFADRGPLQAPPAVLVRNARVWTCGPQGTLTQADLLARGGKIVQVGSGIAAPATHS